MLRTRPRQTIEPGAGRKARLVTAGATDGKGRCRSPPAGDHPNFDWLSRDAAEVDRYIADPHCGMPSSNRLWYDLLGGMLEITSFRTLRRIPMALPILITGGESDPVGGRRGQRMLAHAYRDTGHIDVTLKLYPEGRHEMLNEMNRDEFTRDLLRWIDRKRES